MCAYARETESALESTPQIVDSAETLRVDTLEMDSIEQIIESMADTLVLEPIFPQHWSDSTLSDIDFRMMEWAMGWLDTTGCVAYKDTIVLPDSVYKARLQALPCVVELPYNQIVKRFILRYVQRGQKQVARMKRMSEYYFPIFEEALDRYGLPYELELMPVIESALNPQAHSHMGAAGLWQFMPATGKRYGLEINSLVDERMDPIKSTEAACRFLKAMYDIFQDWNLVIAAYNCGSGNVSKAIHRAGGKRDFWSIYPYLPRETRSYLPIFIAANYAMNYSDEHGICPAPLEKIMLTDTILTNRRLHLEQVSTKLEIPLDELRRLNPQYTRDILPGGTTYALCLPSEKAGPFIEQQDSIYAHKADQLINNRRAEIDMAKVTDISGAYRVNGVTYYTIKNGDTLGGIAKKFRCSVKQLKAWNGLKNDNIRAGRKLKIYK